MKFGIFFEHQLPRPWSETDELTLFQNALDQCEVADQLGYDYLWQVEHHFLEEYSHSSAPEILLAAASQRTKRIRLGHGVRLMPPGYNHPVRVAEQMATLDLVSGGRAEWGTGTSASKVELAGFGVAHADRHAMWEEAVRESVRMMTETPYPGYAGRFFDLPARNVVPKPVQKPHPPLWLACSNLLSVEVAARHGVGALAFSPLTAAEAATWVDRYEQILRDECVPIGASVNPNLAIVTGFGCARSLEQAQTRFAPGLAFYAFALLHYYRFGAHRPGETDLSQRFAEAAQLVGPHAVPTSLDQPQFLDTPQQLERLYRGYEAAGVDQVAFFHQAGRTRHEHIVESLELFAREAMPSFKARDEGRAEAKALRLRGVIEAAFARKAARQAGAPSPRPEPVEAYLRDQHLALPTKLRRFWAKG